MRRAVRVWLGSPDASQPSLAESLKGLGATTKQIEQWTKKYRHQPLPVAKNNWDALVLFLASTTQWRVSSGKILGLDYAALETTARLCEISLDKKIFQKLQILEQTTLQLVHRRQEHADQYNN